ncbi:MAG: hypothetical protein H0W53_02570 [Acidobacteria bacterium]|nr:hypothetical protein [Acidobacteriota bacterium]
MASETRREAHRRLQKRTIELAHEHQELSLDRTRFNQTDHDEHSADLRKHSADLKKHGERLNEAGK